MKLETLTEVKIYRIKPNKLEIMTICRTGQADLRLDAHKGGETRQSIAISQQEKEKIGQAKIGQA